MWWFYCAIILDCSYKKMPQNADLALGRSSICLGTLRKDKQSVAKPTYPWQGLTSRLAAAAEEGQQCVWWQPLLAVMSSASISLGLPMYQKQQAQLLRSHSWFFTTLVFSPYLTLFSLAEVSSALALAKRNGVLAVLPEEPWTGTILIHRNICE